MLVRFRKNYLDFKKGSEYEIADTTAKYLIAMSACKRVIDLDSLVEEEIINTPAEDFTGEPIQGEPIQGEPIQDEPIQDEPIQDEPIQDEPIQDEPIQDEPIQDEPIQDKVENKAVKKPAKTKSKLKVDAVNNIDDILGFKD